MKRYGDTHEVYFRLGERERIEKKLKRKLTGRDLIDALMEKLKLSTRK